MVEHLRAVLRGTEPADGSGHFRAIATHAGSLIVGERGPTRFADGAFRNSLKQTSRYPLLLQHADDRVIGTAEFSEASEGLMMEGRLVLDVKDAAETYALMKAGALTDVSIGFECVRAHHEKQGESSVRIVDEARLAECSVVTWGADKRAKILTVHSESESAFDGLVEGLAAANREAHEGRVFSAASLGKLRDALAALVDLVGKVDPGHVAALGRKAARMMKKSIVLIPGKKQRKAYRDDRLRRMALQAVGVDELPLLPQPYTPEPDPEYGLLAALNAICGLPEGARRALFSEAVKQYLTAIEDAEPVEEEEPGEVEEPGEEEESMRETHIHNPHVVADGDRFKVVDDDGKVYGTHDSRAEADAQVAALRAAMKD